MELNKEELEFILKILKEEKDLIQFSLKYDYISNNFKEKLNKNLKLCDSSILKLQEESESLLYEKN